MTEADLDSLLNKSSRRMRLNRGLRVGLAALGIGLLLAAGLVLISRLKNYDALLLGGLITPPFLAVVALVVAYVKFRPAPRDVAVALDRRANSAEHLVTWHEYRATPHRIQSPLQREFLEAQRNSTLKTAAAFDARKLVPLNWPAWSRVVLLAFVLLCCAWLTPRNDGSEGARSAIDDARNRRNAGRTLGDAGGDGSAAAMDEIPGIETLSQPDQQKFMLLASDDKLPESMKSEQFKDLQAKLAGIPENQLTPLDRQLLNQLRPPGANPDKLKDANGSDASSTSAGKENPHDSENGGSVRPAKGSAEPAKVYSAIRTQFPAELQHKLDSYYKPSETRNELHN